VAVLGAQGGDVQLHDRPAPDHVRDQKRHAGQRMHTECRRIEARKAWHVRERGQRPRRFFDGLAHGRNRVHPTYLRIALRARCRVLFSLRHVRAPQRRQARGARVLLYCHVRRSCL
jgi:hypothetical protein